MKSKFFFLIRTILGIALFTVVLVNADLGQFNLQEGAELTFFMVMILGLMSFLNSIGAFIITAKHSTDLPIRRLTQIATSSSFYNMIVPLSGTASRVVLLKKEGEIGLDLAFGVTVHTFSVRALTASAVAIALLCDFGIVASFSLSLAFVLVSVRFMSFLNLKLKITLKRKRMLQLPSMRLLEILQVASFELAYLLVQAFVFVLLSTFFQQNLSLTQGLFLAAFSVTISSIPITPGAFGLKEGSVIIASTIVGFPALIAASVAILDRIVLVFWVAVAYTISNNMRLEP